MWGKRKWVVRTYILLYSEMFRARFLSRVPGFQQAAYPYKFRSQTILRLSWTKPAQPLVRIRGLRQGTLQYHLY